LIKKVTELDEPIRVSEDNFGIFALFGKSENFGVSMGVDLHLLLMCQIGMLPALKDVFLDEFLLFVMIYNYAHRGSTQKLKAIS
jgi:hypothetical protein